MSRDNTLLLGTITTGLVEALSSLVLLAVSVWFISACAVAGMASAAPGFNYLIPATVIRALAVTRIAAGYTERYLGHLLLLRRLAAVRGRVLSRILGARRGPEHARATALLQHSCEQWAAKYTAVIAPQLHGVILLAGLLLCVSVLHRSLFAPMLGLIAMLLLLRRVLLWQAQRMIKEKHQASAVLDRNLERWLQGVALWSLRPDWQDGESIQRQAGTYALARRRVTQLLERGEALLLTGGLAAATALWVLLQDLEASPVLTVPVLVVASLRDWLKPSLGATLRGVELDSDTALAPYRGEPGPPDGAPPLPERPGTCHELRLENLQWLRDGRAGPRFSATLPGPGLHLLRGPSGIGKSSLLAALAGELDYEGKAIIDGTELRQLAPRERRARLHFSEQFAHVLSDTLAHNLRLAAPGSSDEQLLAALAWSELDIASTPGELHQWLGDEGRRLSGGEQKRLALARAWLRDAPVWLLDEPFEGMDDALAGRLAAKLNEVRRRRLLIIASHLTPGTLAPDSILSYTRVTP